MTRYRLKLKRLDFISAVDAPAQETAKVVLIKRALGQRVGEIDGFARVAKVDESLGLVFCWAFTPKDADGKDYFDLHGDNIDADFVKVAAEFMEGKRAVDEMHDGEQTGQVVFAMPMTPEIAKAFGVETKTVGLMVAIRPSADALAKFKSGEYTGVSIAGLGEREVIKSGRPVLKSVRWTNEVDGHQHELVSYESQGGPTMALSYATSAGAEHSHSHAVVQAPDGSLTILADSGHSHTFSDDATRTDPQSASKSTPKVTKEQGASMTLEEALERIKELEAKLESAKEEKSDAEKRASLTDAHKAHLKSLSGSEASAFLTKSATERDAILAEIAKADAVVFTCADGTEIRKSHGDIALRLAKQADEANKLAKQERDARELTELTKRAGDTLGFLAGADGEHIAILKAVEGIADEKVRTAAIATLKSANDVAKKRTVAKGAGQTDPGSASADYQGELDALVIKTKAEHKVADGVALDMVMATAKGKELYAAISKSTIRGK